MTPRKNALLPYLKIDRLGRLTYVRRVPTELRKFLGGKSEIRRSLGTPSADVTSAPVLAAYTKVKAEADAALQRAQELATQSGALVTADTEALRAGTERFPLSKRDVAGIAGQVLLDIREAVEKQQSVSKELGKAVAVLAMRMQDKGLSGLSAADFSVLARPALDSLGVDPSPQDLEAIGQAVLKYLPVMQGDIAKLQQFDFSEPKLAVVAPPAPKRQATWRELTKAWLRSTGGVLERDGFGVSQEREAVYLKTVKEFQKNLTTKPPAELTIEDARKYLLWLQTKSKLSVRSQQNRIVCMKTLMKIGISQGLVDHNPFGELLISQPAGADDELGYRPLTKDECISVFNRISTNKKAHYRVAFYILICTGCRLSEATQLRTTDIKQTKKGTWYIDWKHEPTADLPMFLKTKASNNRSCPIHPRLIDAGLLELDRSDRARLFPDAPSQTAFSNYFKSLLQDLKMWEPRKTVIHSLRGSAKDFQRDAGVRLEFRNAFTGHASGNTGESEYGIGLKAMPDVLAEEMNKVDYSWLP